jgi:glucoamylase
MFNAPISTAKGPARTNRSDAAVAQIRGKVEISRAAGAVDLAALGPHLYALMLRNVATDGFTFSDPSAPGDVTRDAKPGCVIAAPSFPADTPGIDEDYVFCWVRDAALTAMELVSGMPDCPGGAAAQLNDYVRFADLCHANAAPTTGHACFTIAGRARPWTEQNDGPALQSIAILAAYPQLDPNTQRVAVDLVNANVAYLLGVYQQRTTNLWEEHTGYSFFARAVQLRCFEQVLATAIAGIDKPAALQSAAAWLRQALAGHWDGARYVSVLADAGDGSAPSPQRPVVAFYDPNIDIVLACIYGAVPATDTKLLATAAQLRSQWEPGGLAAYPVNGADAARGLGPMFGRYPGDVYDGDTSHPVLGGHPWALCTCAVAELHYRLAAAIVAGGPIPLDDLSAPFFAPSGVDPTTSPGDAATALVRAGDAMLQAVVYHSDNLELSEQFDGTTGFERSVSNLTWSYGAFLSALRARAGAVEP